MIGKTILHYKITEKLGEGGMGEVYKAEDTKLKRDVAIKFLPRQIAAGLQTAHKKGVVHRDIKSANIMITDEDQVKIMDFGLAKLAGQTMLTKSGTTLGTVAYMSPEQARGEKVDQRTDIWSFGVVLYEMLTGQLPFKGDYEQAVMYSIMNEEPEPIAEFRSDVPLKLQQTVDKALQKKPDDRFKEMKAVLKDLRAIVREVESGSVASDSEEEQSLPSIAVLPFSNMSANPEQEYFCDGMAEEIINALTHVGNLHVVARTSAFSFKGQQVDIREIGQKLNVEHVLEGSVRKAGNRLRITAQLIKIADGYHLWSERYDREMDDVFAIQDEISLAIVDKLKVELLGSERAAIEKRYTENLEAYNLYLQGKHFWQLLSPEACDKAQDCFERALTLDSDYALAYVGLGMLNIIRTFFGNLAPHKAYPQVKLYAQKALEIDKTLAEAHTILGFSNMVYDWNWQEAKQVFEQALHVNQNEPLTHIWYSNFLRVTGRHDEAIAEARRAEELDPLSSYIKAMIGVALWFAGRHDEAIEIANEAIALNPHEIHARHALGYAYEGKAMLQEAVSAYKGAVDFSGGSGWSVALLGAAYCQVGDQTQANKLFASLKQRSKKEYIQPTCFYMIHKGRGDLDRAYEALEEAYEMHDSFLCYFNEVPLEMVWRLPDEPRFKAVMKKIGLQPRSN